MSTTQTLCTTEMWQPEPQTNLVGSTPVEERTKLSVDRTSLQSIQDYTWEDFRGLPLFEEEDW